MASSSSVVGGSRRSGRELISTAVPLSRQAAKTASASNSDCPLVPRLPVTSRPVQCPSTLTSGLRTAATMRRVIGSASIFSLECTDATRTSSRRSISSVWSSEPSSRMSTSMPLSSRKEPPPELSPELARCSFTASTTSSCRVSRATERPLATVSRGEWSVSTR